MCMYMMLIICIYKYIFYICVYGYLYLYIYKQIYVFMYRDKEARRANKGMMPSVLGVDGYNPSAPQYDQAMAKSEGKMDVSEGATSSAPKPVAAVAAAQPKVVKAPLSLSAKQTALGAAMGPEDRIDNAIQTIMRYNLIQAHCFRDFFYSIQLDRMKLMQGYLSFLFIYCYAYLLNITSGIRVMVMVDRHSSYCSHSLKTLWTIQLNLSKDMYVYMFHTLIYILKLLLTF
jgi:hypothetical protein